MIRIGSSTPVDSRAGSTAAKTARLIVLAPLTAVLEKPTRVDAAASTASCQRLMVSMSGKMVSATVSAAPGGSRPLNERLID